MSPFSAGDAAPQRRLLCVEAIQSDTGTHIEHKLTAGLVWYRLQEIDDAGKPPRQESLAYHSQANKNGSAPVASTGHPFPIVLICSAIAL